MKFTFEDQTYLLEFSRKKDWVTTFKNDHAVRVMSKHPFTTVRLYLLVGETKTQMAHATVGCLPTDVYSPAAGRLYALRGMHTALKNQRWTREFLGLMWQAYMDRGKIPVVNADVVGVTDETATVSESVETVH